MGDLGMPVSICLSVHLFIHLSTFTLGVLWAQLFLQFFTDCFETWVVRCVKLGWLGVAVMCVLRDQSVQLILAYSWARPAILVADKGIGVMFLFLLFLHFHSCSSFFPVPLFYLLYYLSSPSLWETTQNDPGDQEVAGSTPAEVSNILSWRLIMKYFLRSFSPFRWFKRGSCQFLAKECAQYWLTA